MNKHLFRFDIKNLVSPGSALFLMRIRNNLLHRVGHAPDANLMHALFVFANMYSRNTASKKYYIFLLSMAQQKFNHTQLP